jgi:Cys-tRNA(Pro)/Cys-tRNA(Cys) deacylase
MSSNKQTNAGTPAIMALRRVGVSYTVHSFRHDQRSGLGYGLEAARALNIETDRVFKTLIAAVDGELTVAVVPVAGSLDLKALAAALGGKRAVMAPVSAAERASGYVIGGVSPIGLRRTLPTVIDASASRHATILVSGGARGLDIELAATDLAAVTGGCFAPIARFDNQF